MPPFAVSAGGMLTDRQIDVIAGEIRSRWSRRGILDGVQAPSYAAKSTGDAQRGEAAEDLSRELGVPLYKLERWRQKAEAALESALRERETDAATGELATAMQRIGELSIEVELLRSRIDRTGPLGRGRILRAYVHCGAALRLIVLKYRACRRQPSRRCSSGSSPPPIRGATSF